MMKIILISTILFYSSNWVESLEIPVITNIQDMIGLAHDVGDIAAGNIPFKNFFTPAVNPILPVLDKLDDITEQIENLDTKLDDLLATLIARLPLEDQINTDVREVQNYITIIEETYDEFLDYSQNISIYSNRTLEEYVNYVTSTRTENLLNILNRILNIIVPKKTAFERVGFLENTIQKRKMMTSSELCNPRVSFQNRLLQIYNLLSITEMRSFLMTTFGFRLNMELTGTKSLGEYKRAESAFVMRLDQYLTEFKKVMLKASREIYLCDPESLTDESTYIELKGLFTAFVINEEQKDSSCSINCGSLSGWNHENCFHNPRGDTYCTKHPCRGMFHKCGWIGGDVNLCENPAGSLKRYQWVRSYSNGYYGKWTDCHDGTNEDTGGDRKDFYDCDTCICQCEETFGTSPAIRTFSLHPQVSNIDENKVISDVKFTLKDKMIHIQIEEAPLLPLGQLNRSESSWVPLEDFIYLSNLTGGGFVQVQDGQHIPMTPDVDYTFIRWNQKLLNLDEISGGPNYVLTGVKLGHESQKSSDDESEENNSPLQLEIQVTPFNYSSGKLIPTEEKPSVWLKPLTQPQLPPAYAEERTVIGQGAEHVYISASPVNPPHLKPNQYIEFKQSTIHSDAGQSTIPFIDSRPVAPSNTLAYDGLGLAYRGHEQFAGFVLLKALTIDITNYMDASMTDKQRSFYMKTSRQGAANTPPKKKRGSRRRNY